ncbi:MAG: undecaprenyl-diphosphatase UppP [Chitinophagaceae bacterium]|nr:undecaprenyl-diphosphatase UppP [Oligoflexus sp.]
MEQPVISGLDSFILGIVEGITEYLPISSTGHLVVTSKILGLSEDASRTADQIAAIQAFEIVIQAGAILAVLFLYKKAIIDLIAGVFGKSEHGRKVFINICFAVFPVLIVGFLLKDAVKNLQFTAPVLIATVVGGLAMILFERFYARRPDIMDKPHVGMHELTPKQAIFIGCCQCLALWPGTSRSMVTIMSGMFTGLKRPIAAEFSFLVGLPVLLLATAYKGMKSGRLLIDHIGPSALLIGLVTSAVFAFFAVKWLVSFLNKRGLELFGWYRLAFALVIYFVVGL